MSERSRCSSRIRNSSSSAFLPEKFSRRGARTVNSAFFDFTQRLCTTKDTSPTVASSQTSGPTSLPTGAYFSTLLPPAV